MYYVYILTNERNGTLYIGSTSNLIKRIWQHKEGLLEGFTKKYKVTKLMYFEELDDAQQMVIRERQLKVWKREWKLELIEKTNPHWKDLYDDILQ
jgi:putative endonuclease